MNKIAKTINMYIIAEMHRTSTTASYEYQKPTIVNNKIIIVPTDPETSFIDAYLSDSFVSVDNIEDNLRIFGINLSVNVELTDTADDNFHIEQITDLGEIVIALDANDADHEGSAIFVEPVTVNLETDLVVEEAENASEVESEADKPSAEDIEEIEAEVLTEAELSDEEGPQWLITYELNPVTESLTENESDDQASNTAIITAPNIESAAKYAKQNAILKARDNDSWADAEIISIEKKSN